MYCKKQELLALFDIDFQADSMLEKRLENLKKTFAVRQTRHFRRLQRGVGGSFYGFFVVFRALKMAIYQF